MIIVENTEFRWHATGNDGWITVAIWSADKDIVKLIGSFEYHDEYINEIDERGAFLKTKGQIIILALIRFKGVTSEIKVFNI